MSFEARRPSSSASRSRASAKAPPISRWRDGRPGRRKLSRSSEARPTVPSWLLCGFFGRSHTNGPRCSPRRHSLGRADALDLSNTRRPREPIFIPASLGRTRWPAIDARHVDRAERLDDEQTLAFISARGSPHPGVAAGSPTSPRETAPAEQLLAYVGDWQLVSVPASPGALLAPLRQARSGGTAAASTSGARRMVRAGRTSRACPAELAGSIDALPRGRCRRGSSSPTAGFRFHHILMREAV
jgi:hypothetical protein